MSQLPRTFVLTVNRPIKRFDDTAAHLNQLGIKWEAFIGFDNTKTRLQALDSFDMDRAGEHIGAKHIAATLTHYLLWATMKYQPDESFVSLEFDVRFVDGWQEQFNSAMNVLPDDWDLVYLGSCCNKGRKTYPVAEWMADGAAYAKTNLYDVRYPLCGHAIMYRKKCLETLLDVHQSISMPLDIAMYNLSLPKLKVFTILPPICVQADTIVAP